MVFLESYLHYYSKNVLKSWFQGDKLKETKYIFNEFSYCENEFNNENILFEYCIVKNNEYNSIDYSWTDLLGDGVSSYNPTYQVLREKDINVIAVIDIVIMDRGKPAYFLEVMNTNPVSSIKLEKLKRLGMKNLYEIDASWIMKQTGMPNTLKYDKLI
tara:strand:+ start:2584 stop:3057 length:474 start_codon:yes stop_codon:yes gene_type:complete